MKRPGSNYPIAPGLPRLQSRPTDFPQPSVRPVYLASTTTTCCCFHWIGGVGGGIIGAAVGWKSAHANYRRALHPSARRHVVLGWIVGAIVSTVLTVVALQWHPTTPLARKMFRLAIAIALPIALIIPTLIGMLAGALINRLRMSRRVEDGGVYCVRCLYDLRGSLDAGRCPECGVAFDPSVVREGMHFGVHAAWRATWMAFLGCLLGTAIGLGLLWLLLRDF